MNTEMIVNMPELKELRTRTIQLLTEVTESFKNAVNFSQVLKLTRYQKYFSDSYDSTYDVIGRAYKDEEGNYKRIKAYAIGQLKKLDELEEEWNDTNKALICQLDLMEMFEYRKMANTGYTNGIPPEYAYFFDKYRDTINEMFTMLEKLKYQEMYKTNVVFFSEVVWHSIEELARGFWVLREQIKLSSKGVLTKGGLKELGIPQHWAETEMSWRTVKEEAEKVLLPPEPIPEPIDRAAITKSLTERVEIVKQRLDEMLDTEIIETIQKVSYMLGRYGGLYAALLLAHDETSDEKFKKTTDKIDERLEKLESDAIELAAELGYMV